jgi:hypothetical protein
MGWTPSLVNPLAVLPVSRATICVEICKVSKIWVDPDWWNLSVEFLLVNIIIRADTNCQIHIVVCVIVHYYCSSIVVDG